MHDEDFGHWRTLAQASPSEAAWRALMTEIDRVFAQDQCTPQFEKEIVPYIQDMVWRWPDDCRIDDQDILSDAIENHDPCALLKLSLSIVDEDTCPIHDVWSWFEVFDAVESRWQVTTQMPHLNLFDESGDADWMGCIPDERTWPVRSIWAIQMFLGSALSAILEHESFPMLESLNVDVEGYSSYADMFGFEPGLSLINAPMLKSLEISFFALHPEAVKVLAQTQFPRLESLKIEIVTGALPLLVNAPWFKQLHSLYIELLDFPEENEAYDEWRIANVEGYQEDTFLEDGRSLIEHDLDAFFKVSNKTLKRLVINGQSEETYDSLALFNKAQSFTALEQLHLSTSIFEYTEADIEALNQLPNFPAIQNVQHEDFEQDVHWTPYSQGKMPPRFTVRWSRAGQPLT